MSLPTPIRSCSRCSEPPDELAEGERWGERPVEPPVRDFGMCMLPSSEVEMRLVSRSRGDKSRQARDLCVDDRSSEGGDLCRQRASSCGSELQSGRERPHPQKLFVARYPSKWGRSRPDLSQDRDYGTGPMRVRIVPQTLTPMIRNAAGLLAMPSVSASTNGGPTVWR